MSTNLVMKGGTLDRESFIMKQKMLEKVLCRQQEKTCLPVRKTSFKTKVEKELRNIIEKRNVFRKKIGADETFTETCNINNLTHDTKSKTINGFQHSEIVRTRNRENNKNITFSAENRKEIPPQRPPRRKSPSAVVPKRKKDKAPTPPTYNLHFSSSRNIHAESFESGNKHHDKNEFDLDNLNGTVNDECKEPVRVSDTRLHTPTSMTDYLDDQRRVFRHSNDLSRIPQPLLHKPEVLRTEAAENTSFEHIISNGLSTNMPPSNPEFCTLPIGPPPQKPPRTFDHDIYKNTKRLFKSNQLTAKQCRPPVSGTMAKPTVAPKPSHIVIAKRSSMAECDEPKGDTELRRFAQARYSLRRPKSISGDSGTEFDQSLLSSQPLSLDFISQPSQEYVSRRRCFSDEKLNQMRPEGEEPVYAVPYQQRSTPALRNANSLHYMCSDLLGRHRQEENGNIKQIDANKSTFLLWSQNLRASCRNIHKKLMPSRIRRD